MKKIFFAFVLLILTASLALAAENFFSKMDKDEDGRVSREECLDWANKTFDKLDKNGDGILQPDELESLDKSRREQLMRAADLNKDGVILKEEFVKTAQSKFSKLDKNKDGCVSKKEHRSSFAEKNAQGFVIFTF